MNRMYELHNERIKTYNPFFGCEFDCRYCYAKPIAKRQKHRCDTCYTFEPHFHQERLNTKFKAGETVFVCSMGDISFATRQQLKDIMSTLRKNNDTTFLLQSKNPKCFIDFLECYSIPDNVILGTTLETTNSVSDISKAPEPYYRFVYMLKLRTSIYNNIRRYVIIEPIMNFDLLKMVSWIRDIKPEFVYIGYDNHHNQLPEPSLSKTNTLIEELENITEVRLKTMRNAGDR